MKPLAEPGIPCGIRFGIGDDAIQVVIVVLMLALSGCAAIGPPVLKGQSGPIAWEVADIVQAAEGFTSSVSRPVVPGAISTAEC